MCLKHLSQICAAMALVNSLVSGCANSGTDANTDSPDESFPADSSPSNSGSIQINVLETSDEGGPELTNSDTNDAGIHLRRFYAWTNPEQAESDLAALSFSDGGDRSALANVLVQEGGTLIALFNGLQSNVGAVGSDIETADINGEQLEVKVNTQVSGSCIVSEGSGAPFRILHVTASAPNVLFREVIQQCVGDESNSTTRISGVTVDFRDNATARIDWVQPSISSDQIRYDVIDVDREEEIYDGVIEPSLTIAGIVPGIIYTRRIVPIDANGEALSQGTPIALMVDAPSGAFRGRAVRDDLEKLKTSLAGNEARNCGEFTVPYDDDSLATEVSDCVRQALEDGVAFTADRTILGEALSFDSLVGDSEGSSWLLKQGNSDISLANDFTRSTIFGGYLTGVFCSLPAVSTDMNSSVFTCQVAF